MQAWDWVRFDGYIKNDVGGETRVSGIGRIVRVPHKRTKTFLVKVEGTHTNKIYPGALIRLQRDDVSFPNDAEFWREVSQVQLRA